MSSEVEKVWNKVLPMLQKAAAKDARRAATSILRKEGGPLVTLLLGNGGKPADAKPCPVTGVMNVHRRYSYLMPEARTPENLAKFKKKALPAKKTATKKGSK